MSKTAKFRVGLLAAGSVVLFLLVALWLSRRDVGYETIPCVSYFSESVIGLDLGSIAYYRGVHIGRVTEITTAPGQKVAVYFDVYPEKMDPVTAKMFRELSAVDWSRNGLRMRIASSGFTGRKFLEADFLNHPPERLLFAPPANYIPSAPSTYANLEQGVLEALESIHDVGESARVSLRNLDASLKVFSKSADTLAVSARDLRRDVQQPLEEMERTLRSIRRFVTALERDPSALIRGQ